MFDFIEGICDWLEPYIIKVLYLASFISLILALVGAVTAASNSRLFMKAIVFILTLIQGIFGAATFLIAAIVIQKVFAIYKLLQENKAENEVLPEKIFGETR